MISAACSRLLRHSRGSRAVAASSPAPGIRSTMRTLPLDRACASPEHVSRPFGRSEQQDEHHEAGDERGACHGLRPSCFLIVTWNAAAPVSEEEHRRGARRHRVASRRVVQAAPVAVGGDAASATRAAGAIVVTAVSSKDIRASARRLVAFRRSGSCRKPRYAT